LGKGEEEGEGRGGRGREKGEREGVRNIKITDQRAERVNCRKRWNSGWRWERRIDQKDERKELLEQMSVSAVRLPNAHDDIARQRNQTDTEWDHIVE
jgi:hypothetical protein